MPATKSLLQALLAASLAGCLTPPAPPELSAEVPVPPAEITPEAWSLVPTSVQHEGSTLFVQAALAYTPSMQGDVELPRDREIYVGVTAVTSTGEEIDLAVTTFFPGHFQDPFTLSADVGPDVQDVLFGVWDRKVEPCDSTRSGCKEFGFLLDGSLATWPPTVYIDGTRQRIPSDAVDLLVLDAGVGTDLATRVEASTSALGTELRVFGVAPTSTTIRPAPAPAAESHLQVRNSHDVLIGRQLVAALGLDAATVAHDPEAPAAFVLTLAGPHADAVDACKEHQDVAYLSCLGER